MHMNQGIETRDELLRPRKTGGRKWVKIALWVMVVVLAGWYFLGEETSRQPGAQGENRSGKQGSEKHNLAMDSRLAMGERISSALRAPEAGDEFREGDPEAFPSTGAVKKGARARELIKSLRDREGKMDLDEAFRQAERLRDEGLLVDAHLMYFFAAKQGHAESALLLGTMYDPEHALEIPGVVEEPSWTQAHKWYLMAAEGGNEKAGERLQYLRKQVESAAAAGELEAARLLLQWQ